jgi:methylmalonyl-CoA mutase N-terminal domain/subunit
MFPTAEFRNEERAKYIEKLKQRQELKRQQEEREAAARKAAEKTPYEKSLDKLKEAKKLINSIQIGSPMNEGYIAAALKQICDILDFCLNEIKPENSSEK